MARPTKEQLQDIPETDFSKAKPLGRGLRKDRRLPLRALRESVGKTQVDVARHAEMAQGDVSQLERREDARISTLRRYVEALGGELELVAVFPKTGHRIRVEF